MGFTLLGILSSAAGAGGAPGAGYMLYSSGVKLVYATETIVGVSITNNEQFVSNYSSSTHGYINGTSNTPKYSFADESETTLSGTAGQFGSAMESSTAGYSMGQSANTGQDIQKRVFSTDTLTTIANVFADTNRRESSAAASSTKGYHFGGRVGERTTISAFPFSTETSSELAAVLSVDRAYSAAFESDVAAYVTAGGSNTVDKLTFSTETRTTLATSLPDAGFSPAAIASIEAGYVAGGTTDIYKINFATDTVSTLSATLTTSQSGARAHFTFKG